jgi:hypothetical protein
MAFKQATSCLQDFQFSGYGEEVLALLAQRIVNTHRPSIAFGDAYQAVPLDEFS